MIIFDRAATDTDGANQNAILVHYRDTAWKSDQAVVGVLDPE